MIAAELMVGALGASVSLGAGLVKLIKERVFPSEPHAAVTIRMGQTTLQREGSVPDVRKVWSMTNRAISLSQTNVHRRPKKSADILTSNRPGVRFVYN